MSETPSPSGWAIERKPHTGVWITPVEGWGFHEAIDGTLAPPFEIHAVTTGVEMGDGIRGWRATVLSSDHRYAGMSVEITPRHTQGADIVVIKVTRDAELIFSGMAEAEGLERSWDE